MRARNLNTESKNYELNKKIRPNESIVISRSALKKAQKLADDLSNNPEEPATKLTIPYVVKDDGHWKNLVVMLND